MIDLDLPEGIITIDGFDDAFLGVGTQFNREIAIYDTDKVIEILMTRDGMSEDDAWEHFSFNIIGAWVGDQTPIFL